jgi:hypothetical protein
MENNNTCFSDASMFWETNIPVELLVFEVDVPRVVKKLGEIATR